MNKLKKEYDNIEVPPEVDLAIEKGIKKGKEYKRKRGLKPFAVIAAGLVLAFGIVSGGKLLSTENTSVLSLHSSNTLPIVGSLENLQKLLKTYTSQNNMAYGSDTSDGTAKAKQPRRRWQTLPKANQVVVKKQLLFQTIQQLTFKFKE